MYTDEMTEFDESFDWFENICDENGITLEVKGISPITRDGDDLYVTYNCIAYIDNYSEHIAVDVFDDEAGTVQIVGLDTDIVETVEEFVNRFI